MASAEIGFFAKMHLSDAFYHEQLGVVVKWYIQMFSTRPDAEPVAVSGLEPYHVRYGFHAPDEVDAFIQKLRAEWGDPSDGD